MQICSFYQFLKISADDVSLALEILQKKGQELDLRGLILIAREGINGSFSGERENTEEFKKYFIANTPFKPEFINNIKISKHPFRKWIIKRRSEVVTFGHSAQADSGKYLTPFEWQSLLESNEDFELLDVRNVYESDIGMFEKSRPLKMDDFREFPKSVEGLGISKDKKILMYCTGGIRCEKASRYLSDLGYKNVFQLHGGILNYLREVADGNLSASKFLGECFVFDDRVSLNQNLEPTERYHFCVQCGQPTDQKVKCTQCEGIDASSCE